MKRDEITVGLWVDPDSDEAIEITGTPDMLREIAQSIVAHVEWHEARTEVK